MVVLPSCIVLLLLVFYLALWFTGTTLEQATDQGWIRSMVDPPVWYRTWDYLQFHKVMWSAIPHLVFSELGMIFVVALSSSLDVAAIDLELKQQQQQQQRQRQQHQQQNNTIPTKDDTAAAAVPATNKKNTSPTK